MNQLILDVGGNAIVLPESQKGGYTAKKEALGEEVQMVSGRLVREIRGNVWRVAYHYGFFDVDTKSKVIESCEKGRKHAIKCTFLPPDSAEMITSEFLVTDFTYPKFMWSRDNMPLWADFAVDLREVKPHD